MPRPKTLIAAPVDLMRLPADLGQQLVEVARARRTSVAAEVEPLLRGPLARVVADPAAGIPAEPKPGHRVKMAKVPRYLAELVRQLKKDRRVASAPAAVGGLIRGQVESLYLRVIKGEAASDAP